MAVDSGVLIDRALAHVADLIRELGDDDSSRSPFGLLLAIGLLWAQVANLADRRGDSTLAAVARHEQAHYAKRVSVYLRERSAAAT